MKSAVQPKSSSRSKTIASCCIERHKSAGNPRSLNSVKSGRSLMASGRVPTMNKIDISVLCGLWLCVGVAFVSKIWLFVPFFIKRGSFLNNKERLFLFLKAAFTLEGYTVYLLQ